MRETIYVTWDTASGKWIKFWGSHSAMPVFPEFRENAMDTFNMIAFMSNERWRLCCSITPHDFMNGAQVYVFQRKAKKENK